MAITQKNLERIFAALPTVNAFVSNNEHSFAFASSLKDVGGRDDDVFRNIQHVYLKKGDCDADIVIEDFYSLGSRTIIQLNIGDEQKPIDAIIENAMYTAFICEIAHISTDWMKLVNYFTNLQEITLLLRDATDYNPLGIVDEISIIEKISMHLDFIHWAREGSKNNNISKLYIKEKYDEFRLGKFVPEKDTIFFCDMLDLYNVLSLDESAYGLAQNENIYPINMKYNGNKFSTEAAGTISNACYRIEKVLRTVDTDSLDIDNDDFVDEFCDKIFSVRTSAIIKEAISEYMMISIDAKRTAGDIIIKFFDGDDVVCLARITPSFETIIYPFE